MGRLLAILAVCILSGGCAVGVTHDYDAAGTKFDIDSKSTVAVAVHDQRSYIVSGEKPANFVGLSRAGFGNPYDVKTESTNALADDFSTAIVTALEADGIAARAVTVSPQENDNAAQEKLLAEKTDRAVLLTIRNWKADTYSRTKLTYDVVLRVFDSGGTKRAQAIVQGEDNLGGDAWNPPSHSRKVVPIAFREKLKELFSNANVVSALK